jgi:hypothetical protein
MTESEEGSSHLSLKIPKNVTDFTAPFEETLVSV